MQQKSNASLYRQSGLKSRQGRQVAVVGPTLQMLETVANTDREDYGCSVF